MTTNSTQGKGMAWFAAAAGALALSAGAAQAQFFSFASDTNDQAWTFQYNPQTNRITHSAAESNPIRLLVDDRNGPLVPVGIDTEFRADMGLAPLQAVDLGGGEWLHVYSLSGSFEFLVDVGGNLEVAMRVEFSDATLTARGTADRWRMTANISGSDSEGDNTLVTYSFFQPLLDLVPDFANCGLASGDSIGPDDFAFTLTSLNTSGAVGFDPAMDPDNIGTPIGTPGGLPIQTWWSEGSFSGSAVIPSPASLALFGLGGLALTRRRR
jgi:MYXO-CTERM domain-containing protein